MNRFDNHVIIASFYLQKHQTYCNPFEFLTLLDNGIIAQLGLEDEVIEAIDEFNELYRRWMFLKWLAFVIPSALMSILLLFNVQPLAYCFIPLVFIFPLWILIYWLIIQHKVKRIIKEFNEKSKHFY